jgi:hypothetical protein
MTLSDAKNIVSDYGEALAIKKPNEGPAFCESRLPHSPMEIMQAMKLLLADEIQLSSFTEDFRNMIATGAMFLPYFIDDMEVQRLYTIKNNFSAANRVGLSDQEFSERSEAIQEVHEWTLNARTAGAGLRGELADFIKVVKNFDQDDPLYWQRVYTLIGLEYSPPTKPPVNKRSFWEWFS